LNPVAVVVVCQVVLIEFFNTKRYFPLMDVPVKIICQKCKQVLFNNCFSVTEKGIGRVCKKCKKERREKYFSAWYKANKEKHLARTLARGAVKREATRPTREIKLLINKQIKATILSTLKERKKRLQREAASRMYYKNKAKGVCISRAKRYRERNPLKYHARMIARNAKVAGKINAQPCLYSSPACKGRLEMHHPNYNSPLIVIFLCHYHHCQTHDQLK